MSALATHFTTFLPPFNHHQKRHFSKTPLKNPAKTTKKAADRLHNFSPKLHNQNPSKHD